MMLENLISLLAGLPPWLLVLVVSMIPFGELRGTILLWGAGFFSSYGPVEIYMLAVLGNMIPIPFLLWLFPRAEAFLRRWPLFARFFDALFARTRKKTAASVEKYEEMALFLFVAIPLPVTGAWTGSLVAYLFGLDRKKSLLFIFLGVLTAGVVMLVLVLVSLWLAVGLIVSMILALAALGLKEKRETR
ncbi:MAG: small multi-drug export protein [Thermoplasmata archaeon]|nr:small multi-drug export protein [Thermoplasmata archaeon]